MSVRKRLISYDRENGNTKNLSYLARNQYSFLLVSILTGLTLVLLSTFYEFVLKKSITEPSENLFIYRTITDGFLYLVAAVLIGNFLMSFYCLLKGFRARTKSFEMKQNLYKIEDFIRNTYPDLLQNHPDNNLLILYDDALKNLDRK